MCGGDCPPSNGTRPRTLCSTACRKARRLALLGRKPRPAAVPCVVCGASVRQLPRVGPAKQVCSEQCARIRDRDRNRKKSKEATCARCGKKFSTKYKKKFCSDKCRYNGRGQIHGDTKPCERCGKPVKVSYRGLRFCSRPCAKKASVFQCLNCGVEFKKKRYKSGAYSCQKKYCSRPCAFEARRLKKKCAVRPLEIAGKLARWFLSWGDDQWPLMATCECGKQFVAQKNGSSASRDKCPTCHAKRAAKKHKSCPDCGGELGKGRWLCDSCSLARDKKNKKRAKKRRRRMHGNACTFRQRCKKYGCPYQNVSKKAVMNRDRWKCRLCGNRLLAKFTTIMGTRTPHPRSPTIDHIVPLSFGPSSPGHVLDNCQAACWECNCERGIEDANSFAARKATAIH